MHELSLCQSLIEIIEDNARTNDISKVRSVTLEIGLLGHVEPESMLFCFDALSRGTIAEGARLVIERMPGAGWCPDCEKTVALAERHGACPGCGSYRVRMTSGDELRVRDMEVE